MGLSEKHWFTEVCEESNSAFALKYANKLHEEQTEFQRIEIYETESFGRLLVIDGFIMLTDRDNFIYHEMMAHPALFSHPSPKNIVIVGGGDCGTLQEVAKHKSVEQITQVEIDERVTRLSEQYFPNLCTANQDPRVAFKFVDAIEWMKNAPSDSIDLVIIDSTDPIGPGEGLFTQSFYESCRIALRQEGLIVQQSESPLIHWKEITQPMRSAMQAAGFIDVQTLTFPLPTYPTGWWSATLAGKDSKIQLVRDQDAKDPGFTTRYYNFGIHLSAFATPEFLREKQTIK